MPSPVIAAIVLLAWLVAGSAGAQSGQQRCEGADVPPDERIAACTSLIEANARADRAFVGRCIARAKRGDLEAAISDCDRALEINPRYVEAFAHRGHAALRLQRLDDAIFHYDETLKLAPARADARFGRGVAHRRKGDIKRGDADLAAARKAAAGIDATMAKLGVTP